MPAGVYEATAKFTVVEQVMMQEYELRVTITPAGSPSTETELKVTVLGEPEMRVAVRVLDTDCPWTTDRFPPFVRE